MSTKRLYILKQTYPHHWRWVGLFVDFFVGYTDEEKGCRKNNDISYDDVVFC